jgi:hypothetical protein
MPNMTPASAAPWWKFGHVWLVFSGPAIVVAASIFTCYLAYVGRDPVVYEGSKQKSPGVALSAAASANNLAPALQARNHAATGVVAPKGN